jgi:hypothetical protein
MRIQSYRVEKVFVSLIKLLINHVLHQLLQIIFQQVNDQGVQFWNLEQI